MWFYSVTYESAGMNDVRTHDARYCINMLDLKTPKNVIFWGFYVFYI